MTAENSKNEPWEIPILVICSADGDNGQPVAQPEGQKNSDHPNDIVPFDATSDARRRSYRRLRRQRTRNHRR